MTATAVDEAGCLRPDYRGGGIVNLMSSLQAGLGGGVRPYPPAALLPVEEVAAARNVVLLVIDGLGHDYLSAHGVGTVLRNHLRGCLTSVFPSTTAAAITTFLTGVAPAEHGVTGWFMYLRELGMVTAILPFRSRAGWLDLGSAGVDIRTIVETPSLFDHLAVAGHIVSPRHLVASDYSRATGGHARRHGYRGLEDFFAQTAGLLRGGGERQFVYAYWPEFDALAHTHGAASTTVLAHLDELDRAFARFLEAAAGTDTLVVVTADHGFVDTTPADWVDLADHPGLADCLALPLCGEPRAAYCYLHPGAENRFTDYVGEHLAGRFDAHPSADAVQQGWFGHSTTHPRLAERIGDFILMPRGSAAIRDRVAGERGFRPVGIHGGASGAEMRVPLLVARV